MTKYIQWRFSPAEGAPYITHTYYVDADSDAGKILKNVLKGMSDNGWRPVGPAPSPIPFDLARAKRGDPIEDADGTPLIFLAHNPTGRDRQRVIVQTNEAGGGIRTYYEDGSSRTLAGLRMCGPVAPPPPDTVDEPDETAAEGFTDRFLEAQRTGGTVVRVRRRDHCTTREQVSVLEGYPGETEKLGAFKTAGGNAVLYNRQTGKAGDFGVLKLAGEPDPEDFPYVETRL